MREDFKYPYRVITRQEEIEGNKALGTLIGMVLAIPICLVDFILLKILPERYINLAWVVIVLGFISYLIF